MIPMILSQLVADADLRAKYSDEHYEEEVEELFRQKFSNNLQVRERQTEKGKGIERTESWLQFHSSREGNIYHSIDARHQSLIAWEAARGIYRASASCKKVLCCPNKRGQRLREGGLVHATFNHVYLDIRVHSFDDADF